MVSVLVGETVGDGVSVNVGTGVSVIKDVGDEMAVAVNVGAGGGRFDRTVITAEIIPAAAVMTATDIGTITFVQVLRAMFRNLASCPGSVTCGFVLSEEFASLLIISPPHLVDDVHEW